MENNYYTDIIGKNILFPIQITTNDQGLTGVYPVNGDFDLIRNNISSVLYYSIGQRFRQEDFGNRLWECMEEPNVQVLAFIIKEFIKEAISTWEQRVTLQDISVSLVGAKVKVQVSYKVNDTNVSQYLNLTYDYMDNSLT